MASLNHARFQQELVRLARAHPDPAELFLARSALMLLSVAQRPLRAHELWVALQVAESKDVEHIERLLGESANADEQRASSGLDTLLGGLISTRQDALDPSETYITLCDPDLRIFLGYLGDLSLPEPVLSLAFSTPQAHVFAAGVCMVICSASPLHLAYVHDSNTASSLVLYAWTHWSEHFSRSGYSLANSNAAGLADSMIFAVCTDLLVFVLVLNDFLTGPVTFPVSQNRTRCSALVKQAQEALEKPIFLLSSIIQHDRCCDTLHAARLIFEASKYSTRSRRLTDDTPFILVSTSTKVEKLQIDRLLATTAPLFGEVQRQVVKAFAEVARGLRLLCVSLVQPPLYEELLKEYSHGWSPLDVLVNGANWMEAVASYPYWEQLSDPISSDAFAVIGTADPYYEVAPLVLARIRKDGASATLAKDHSDGSQQPEYSSIIPVGIRPARWKIASLADKARSFWSEGHPRGTFTINDPRFLMQRTWSFATFPSQMQGSTDHLPFIDLLIPNVLRRFYRRRVIAFFSRVTDSGIFKPLDDLSADAFAGGIPDNWTKLKAAILGNGYLAGFGYFAAAIVLHHIRRVLFPWLSAYMWYTPMEDLRLALSNPDVFLEEALAFSWLWMLFSYGQKYAADIAAGLAMALLAIDSGRVPPNTLISVRGSPAAGASITRWLERLMEVCKVLYLVWVFATVEYIFTRGVNTAAFLTAYYKLLAGGDTEHLALGNILKHNWTKLPLTAWQLWYYVRHGFWPLLWSSLVCTALGQPGLLLLLASVVGGVAALIRYRSTFYIALEISGMFIAVGFLAVTLVLLGVEFFDDPLGLKTSTAVARKRGVRARSVMPQGAGARSQILRRRPALPVKRRNL